MKINYDDLATYFRILYTHLNSGNSIVKALTLLKKNTKNKVLRNVSEIMISDINDGSLFFEAINKHDNIFDDIVIYSIKAGESTGQLEVVLQNLDQYYVNLSEIKKKIKAELMYPKFVIIFAILSNIAISLISDPGNFSIIYEYIIIIVLFLALRYFFNKYIAENRIWKKIKQNFLLNMPGIKKISEKLVIVKFTFAFSLFMKTGYDVIKSLEITSNIIQYDKYKSAIEHSIKRIIAGANISDAFKSANIWPDNLIYFLETSDDTGDYQGLMTKISRYYSDEVQLNIKGLIKVINITAIFIIGMMMISALIISSGI